MKAMKAMKSTYILWLFLCCFLSMNGQDNLVNRFVGITNTPINDILIERNNDLLVATGNGLYRLHDFNIDAELISRDGIYKLGGDKNNRTWLGMYSNQVSSLKKGERFSTGIEETNMITAMVIHDNKVWIGTNNGLYVMSLKQMKEMPHYLAENSKLISNQITDLEVDDKGQVWIGTNRGISIFNGKKWEVQLENKQISAIERNGSEMWVAADKTIHLMGKEKKWKTIAMPLNYMNHMIRDLAFDFNGNLWIATNHILKYQTESGVFLVYDSTTGFDSTMPLCLTVDDQNQVWVGTAGGGLYKIMNALNGKPFAGKIEKDKTAFVNISNKTTAKSPKRGVKKSTPEAKTKKERKRRRRTKEVKSKRKWRIRTSKVRKTEKRETANVKRLKSGVVKSKEEKSNINFLGNRLIKEGVDVEIRTLNIEIAIWDGQNIDGDSVSLYYNGECILDNASLTKERQYFQLEINPRNANSLVLYAHSQGGLGYTTATIAIKGEDEPKKWIVLNSDKKKCDKINFILIY